MAVYKRGRVWFYDFTLNGERHNKSTQARNKRAAEDIERKVRNDLVLGIHGLIAPRECPTFKTFAEGRFLDHVRVRSADKPRTVSYYEEKVRRLLEVDKIAKARLYEITPDLIDQYVTIRAKKVKPASINRETAALRHALKMAEEWNLIRKAPTIRMLPGERTRDFVLTYDLEKLYLSLAPQPLNDAAVLILDTGLRPSECVGLEWDRVVLPDGPTLGYVRILDGKTANARRVLPLTLRAKTMLERRRSFYPEARYVFPGQRKGKHLTIWGLLNIHVTVRDKEVEGKRLFPKDFVVHSLRHTFGTRLGEAGAPAASIMKLMGHASITTSQKYMHPTPDFLERAMAQKEAMDKLLRGDPTDSTTTERETLKRP